MESIWQISPRVADEGSADADSSRGGEVAFRRLFDRYHRSVFRFFGRRSLGPGDCEDLTQEVFLRIYKSQDSFRGDASVETWMFRIAANVYRQELRRRGAARRRAYEVSLEPLGERDDGASGKSVEPADEQRSPLERVLSAEQVALTRAALADLSPQMRRCLLLRGYQEMSYEEIAAVLRTSVATVKVQLHRARQRLRQKLAGSFGDCDPLAKL